MSAIPASSITTNVDGPIRDTHSGRSSLWMDQVSFARVSVWLLIWSRSWPAAAAEGARPITSPPPLVQAAARAWRAVVLPAPAGAIASCSRAPEVAIDRTNPTWPAFNAVPLATISNSATSTAASSTLRPSSRPATWRRRCSAARIRVEV